MNMRVFLFFLLLISTVSANATRYVTNVAPLPDENIASPCRYELVIANPNLSVRAVFVVFERGRDLRRIYEHLEKSSFALRHQLALMMPFHCREKAGTANDEPGNDMDMNPAHGLARALFTALEQFAQTTGHSELTSSKLIFLGFSGTGSLVARMVAYAPDRTVASIAAAPGHWEPLGINTVELSGATLAVPQLIIANSDDKVSGTRRPYEYFKKYYSQGAPMAFLIQNGVPHCCIVNTENFVKSWLEEVIRQRNPSAGEPLKPMDQKKGWRLFLQTKDTDTKDTWGDKTSVVTAAITRSQAELPEGYLPAGWVPTTKLAAQMAGLYPANTT